MWNCFICMAPVILAFSGVFLLGRPPIILRRWVRNSVWYFRYGVMVGPSAGLGNTRKLSAGGESWQWTDVTETASRHKARSVFIGLGRQYSREPKQFIGN